MAKIINENEFENEVLKKPVALVDFYADWCGPCKVMGPIVDEIANEKTDVNVVKVNIDEAMNLSKQYQVVSIPTLCVFKNGELVKKFVGVTEKEDIEELL